MIVLVEAHATIGLGPGNSPAPIPSIAYVVSDEGSISRFATSIPTYKTKQSLIWGETAVISWKKGNIRMDSFMFCVANEGL